MATTRLYHEDPLALSFRARALGEGVHGGRPTVVLDRTAFYPEAGGQMADRGRLGSSLVVDVQVDEQGVVHHVLDGPAPAQGAEVDGEVDRPRRRLHMALHTAQHVLSRALVDIAGAETVSARLGETVCTVDLDGGAPTELAIARAEELCNAVIDDDLPIRAFFPSAEELAVLPLRRAPKVTDHVRVIDIGGFDVSPCGGTHCIRTAQVGLVQVLGVERYKGKLRVSFDAGRRAHRGLAREREILRALARDLTCGAGDVQGAVDKLRRELGESRDANKRQAQRAAEAIAADLVARAASPGTSRIVGVLPGATLELLRAVGARITEAPDAVALLAAPAADGTATVLARGSASSFDCGAFLGRVAALAGGRGGGRPERAEGRLAAGVDWAALVARALGG